MRVLLLGNYENDGQESMQRFAGFMEQSLTQAGHEVRLAKPRALFGQLRPSATGLGKWLGYLDKFGPFPFRLQSEIRWCDVVHICDHSNSFYTQHLRSVPHIVTCHDLLAVRSAIGEIPQNPTRWTGKQLQRMILKGLTRSQHVACVSDATRHDLLRLSGISERRVSLVYNSLAYPYSPMQEPEAGPRLRKLSLEPGQPFLLHVGGNQWYKNRLGVLRIFSILRNRTRAQTFHLVMVGKPWTAEMQQFIREKGMGDVTVELTAVTNEDLRALYSAATMMLFPSLQEGFGWPIAEAQACGCPVATSKRSPMDEVAGDTAVYIDPEDPESAAATISQVIDRAAELKASSLANAVRFRSGMTTSYLSLYERVCDEKRTSPSHELNEPIPGRSICPTEVRQ
jgi:glycosyltransferase involved in cell wall biosynthesis